MQHTYLPTTCNIHTYIHTYIYWEAAFEMQDEKARCEMNECGVARRVGVPHTT